MSALGWVPLWAFVLSQNAVEVFNGLIFDMILDYQVHCDICMKCCKQVKMDSSVESDLRNGSSGVVCSWDGRELRKLSGTRATKDEFQFLEVLVALLEIGLRFRFDFAFS